MSKETKHTPGPWRIGDSGHTIFGPPNGNPSPKTVARIAKLSVPCRVSDIDENVANAQLIASAPELLHTLQDFDVWLMSPALDKKTLAELRQRARQAIAKARGME